jgi:hypothetical protein
VSYTVPSGDHRDRRGPKTATWRFLSKKNQPRLIDLALNNISTGNSPTPDFLHEPETWSPLLAPTKTKQNKEKENNSLHQCYTGRKNSNNPKCLEKTATTGKRARGNKNPSPNGQGEQKKLKQSREEEAWGLPPINKIHPFLSLSRKLSDVLVVRD